MCLLFLFLNKLMFNSLLSTNFVFTIYLKHAYIFLEYYVQKSHCNKSQVIKVSEQISTDNSLTGVEDVSVTNMKQQVNLAENDGSLKIMQHWLGLFLGHKNNLTKVSAVVTGFREYLRE
ncbi:uncharacterized protein LOC136094286 isoform X2 [Hydra vulgaris]|uniref:uncharacterized protein LOC136094286 isoform X2 n=1 Tax=Hydra vulgaris TaxID=6087 RepID=UPI0032EA81AC